MERKKISNNVIWVFKMLVGKYKTKVARLLGLPYSPEQEHVLLSNIFCFVKWTKPERIEGSDLE